MRKRVLALGLLAISLLAGCGKVDSLDYKSLYEAESIKTANKEFEVNSLKLALASYDSKYKDDVDLSQYTVLSTGGVAFNEFNNQIYLSSRVKFEQQDAIQNSIKLNLSNNISISPTDSWVIKTNTSRTDLSNKAGIYGNIEVYKVYDTVAAEFIYSNFMEPFLKTNNLNSANLQYLFIGSSKAGVEASNKVVIDTTDTNLVTKAVNLKYLYDEDKLSEVKAELERARKVKEDNEKATSSLLEQELIDSTEDTQESTEATQESTETVQDSTEAIQDSTEAIETSTEVETTVDTTVETTVETTVDNSNSSIDNEFIDVQVQEFKTKSEEYVFRVGIIMSGESAIVYKFLYKNNDSVSQNKEILDNLISSMQVDNMSISMEK